MEPVRIDVDDHLRAHGFKIVSRPNHGPTYWRLGAWIMTEEEALEVCDGCEEVAKGEARCDS